MLSIVVFLDLYFNENTEFATLVGFYFLSGRLHLSSKICAMETKSDTGWKLVTDTQVLTLLLLFSMIEICPLWFSFKELSRSDANGSLIEA